VKQLQIVWHDRSMPVCGLGLVHQSMRQAARAVGVGCPGGTAQGTCRPETPARRSCGRRADPLGERDGAVGDTERRAGDALQTMTAEERLSLRQAVDWCGSCALTCGRCLGHANSRTTRHAAAADERPTHAPPGHSNSDQAATLVGAVAAALCIQLGRGKMMRSPNERCSRHAQSHSAARNPGRTRFPWASLSFSLEDCVASGSLTPGTAELLARMIEAKLPFLISGGTGAGKNSPLVKTLLGWRIAAVPDGRSARYLRHERAGEPPGSRGRRDCSTDAIAQLSGAASPTLE
jgi:hypothetical protein